MRTAVAKPEYLFSYGTLMPSHAPREIRHVVARFRRVGGGSVEGRLYDLGEYPGAILRRNGGSRVRGQVFELPDPEVLRELDRYEGYNARRPASSLFVRKRKLVTMRNGSTVRCWVYEYNRKPAASALITAGLYPRKSRKQRTG